MEPGRLACSLSVPHTTSSKEIFYSQLFRCDYDDNRRPATPTRYVILLDPIPLEGMDSVSRCCNCEKNSWTVDGVIGEGEKKEEKQDEIKN